MKSIFDDLLILILILSSNYECDDCNLVDLNYALQFYNESDVALAPEILIAPNYQKSEDFHIQIILWCFSLPFTRQLAPSTFILIRE